MTEDPQQQSLFGVAVEQAVDGDAESPVPDQEQRDKIEQDLAATLFVDAGAGSGKTRALVRRIRALVQSGIAMENIAAITFTEKAAAELRHRLRADLFEQGLTEALHQLDTAAISTLHAFAQRILLEHPIEAGLPPGVEVQDEIESQLNFEDQWRDFLSGFLKNPVFAKPLLLADVLGITTNDLRQLAQELERNWDLVDERMSSEVPAIVVDVSRAVRAIGEVGEYAEQSSDPDDKLAEKLYRLQAYGLRLEEIAAGLDADDDTDDGLDRLIDAVELLGIDQPFGTKEGNPYKSGGKKGNWVSVDREQIYQDMFEAGQERDAVRSTVVTAVVEQLARAIGDFILDAAKERRSQGRLRFHDLLVLARDVLRSPEHGQQVRTSLQQRYRRLLIDEFQDTDPIQIELATLLAAPPDSSPDQPWHALEIDPGRLFFVGDPKQSIYRFRRANISTYLRAQTHFGDVAGQQVTLSSNFRSTKPIIDWVNRVFSQVIRHDPDSQPSYEPLVAQRGDPANGPGVLALGASALAEGPKADELRTSEAKAVVRAIETAVFDEWSVRDPAAPGESRPARLGDITILLPARTSLMALERELERREVPYRAETASLVYSSPEIRTLLLVARAVDDPTDELACVAALRSTGFGMGDDDLYRYKTQLRGRWNHQALSDELPHADPVVASMHWMAELHTARTWLSPAEVLDRIVRERQMMELGVCEQRHREVWRRLRFVIDQARAWTETTGGSLREYLRWVQMQASDSSRVSETVLPETDSDAVRIMTIHGSKGLEFPITIVSGLTTRFGGPSGSVAVAWPETGPPGIKIRSGNSTPIYDAFKPLDEQLDEHERLRLLYVACTRAQDHLVVSLFRIEAKDGTYAAALCGGGANEGVETLSDVVPERRPVPEPASAVPLSPPDVWLAERRQALALGSTSQTVAATTLARLAAEKEAGDPGLAKDPRNLDLPAWQKGRYGTAVGRAVHAVLQTVDLATGEGLADAAAAQAAAEGVLGSEGDIEALARSALDSEVVVQASQSTYWRELFVAAPVGDRLLEGYIDLLYDTPDGLVVVDHKTDAWDDESQLQDKVDRYRIQTAAYALAVESATGRPVANAILLFLSADGATARDIVDLDAAKAQVLDLVPAVVAGGEATVFE